MDEYPDVLLADLKRRGYQARLISINRVALLQKQLDELRKKGLFDDDFFEEAVDWFSFQAPRACLERSP